MSVLEAIYHRRSTRTYTGALVDDQTVHALLRAAVHAPTAMHLEPWAFVVVQDPPLLKQISDRAKEIIAGRLPSSRETTHLADPAFDIFYGAGTLIVICARPFGKFVTADCWLAAENLMLAATSFGLGTCPIGFALAALDEPELKAEVGIPPEVTPVAPIVVGYPRGKAPYVPRNDAEILAWHRHGN